MSHTGRLAHLRDANDNSAALGGRVAVIVGAGGAVGRALAARLAASGMELVLADEDADVLEQVTDALQAGGADVLAMVCDVRRRAHVEELADAAMIRFHRIDLLFNGAGEQNPPAPDTPVWELEDEYWDAALGRGLQGTANAVRVFVPLMLACAARDPGYRGLVVNVAPAAAVATAAAAPAAAQAEGVKALSTALERDLQRTGAPLGVLVLQPDAGTAPDMLAEGAVAALSRAGN